MPKARKKKSATCATCSSTPAVRLQDTPYYIYARARSAAFIHEKPHPTVLNPLLSEQELFRLRSIIRPSRNVVICAHRSPDGDAVGSCLGWAEYLVGLGKRVSIVLPNPFPDFLRWMPGVQNIIFYERKPHEARALIAQADLICCLDFSTPARLREMSDDIMKARARRIVIDHHLDPDLAMADHTISRPRMCSTCEVVFRLIHQLGGLDGMTVKGATALYAGMMTDTGGFTYNSNAPEIYLIISLLLAKGINKDKIYRNVYHTFSEHRLRFTGYILNEKLRFYADNRVSLFTITREEMKRFHFVRGDSEGLVNMPLQVKGMRLSISLREDTEKDVVRVSLRSVDDFPCNRMAEDFFNGGGHLNASGGELPFPLESAVRTAEEAIEAYRELL